MSIRYNPHQDWNYGASCGCAVVLFPPVHFNARCLPDPDCPEHAPWHRADARADLVETARRWLDVFRAKYPTV